MNNIHFPDRTISYAQFLEDISRKVAFLVEKRLSEKLSNAPELVGTEEAARILNISPDRHIKDRFPHVKGGGEKQGRLLFIRDSLVRQYAH